MAAMATKINQAGALTIRAQPQPVMLMSTGAVNPLMRPTATHMASEINFTRETSHSYKIAQNQMFIIW
jgi:hypothetical protein